MSASEGEGTQTVAELIAKLREVDPNLPVHIDGCDCAGPAGNVHVWTDSDGVTYANIERADLA